MFLISSLALLSTSMHIPWYTIQYVSYLFCFLFLEPYVASILLKRLYKPLLLCHFNEHCFLRLTGKCRVLQSALFSVCFVFLLFLLHCFFFFCTCMFENEREKKNSKPKCGIVCFFFLFYRDVEGVEPTAQSERVYRPEN